MLKVTQLVKKVFTSREEAPGTHWIGGWMGPRAGLDTVAKRETPSPCRDSNPRSFSPIRNKIFLQVEVFWVATPCSVVVGYQRFRYPRCLPLHPEDGGSVDSEGLDLKHHRQESPKIPLRSYASSPMMLPFLDLLL
jgi:hypothetical protein